MDFLYDANGEIYSMIYGDTQYFYVKNAQGDVVQIRSKWGTTLVEYEYDAWGNCTIAYSHSSYGNLAELNPIRYRGYVYDFETGFYYLQSRYYDSQVRRFINADDPGMLGISGTFLSYNLYAYCENGSSNYNDPSGYGPWTSRLYVWDYYKIHKWVQIAVKNKLDVTAAIEVFVTERDTGKIGRLDVYSFFTNSYYEVKSIGASETGSTKDQMKRYDNSYLPLTNKAKIYRGNNYIRDSFYYGAWEIEFYSHKTTPGLIVYNPKLDYNRMRVAQTIAVFAVATAITYATAGLGAGSYGALVFVQ